MPEKPPSPSNFPTPLQGWLGSEGAENPRKPRFATVGPSRKSSEGGATACLWRSQQLASQQLPQPLPGSQKGLCREPRSPCQGGRVRTEPLLVVRKILAGSQGALRTASEIGLEGEGGCLRSPPPLQTSPPPLRGWLGSDSQDGLCKEQGALRSPFLPCLTLSRSQEASPVT